ncbi:MAG: hypothetical protein JXA71_01575, partial [Chitinispirillaceae bacterium]|nr:hypothetical protein [Chitinispirillaceae bacterium]
LRFICNTPSLISAVVYDMKGDALKTLACERSVPAGEHTLSWDGTSDKRSAVAPGWYFCRLKINTATIYTHLTLLK